MFLRKQSRWDEMIFYVDFINYWNRNQRCPNIDVEWKIEQNFVNCWFSSVMMTTCWIRKLDRATCLQSLLALLWPGKDPALLLWRNLYWTNNLLQVFWYCIFCWFHKIAHLIYFINILSSCSKKEIYRVKAAVTGPAVCWYWLLS